MISIDCDILHVCFEDHVNVIGSKDGLIFDSGTRKSFLFEIERTFHNVKSHKENIKLITCEDSTAVASVYTEVLEQDVIPARGRSNFFKYIKSKDTVLIVADKPKFGAELLNLIYRCKTFTSAVNRILLFLPSCFEEIVCELYGLTTGESSAFDLEEYFEDLVSKECGWDKDNTALSVKEVRVSTDFCNSYILHELKDFYEGKELERSLRCYNVNLDDIEVELSEDNIIKLAIHRDTVDKMRVF